MYAFGDKGSANGGLRRSWKWCMRIDESIDEAGLAHALSTEYDYLGLDG